jgi:outer membrane protein assembly factor BamA
MPTSKLSHSVTKMLYRKFLVRLLIAIAVAAQALAQSRPDSKISVVHCKGLKRFTESQVLPLLNLPPGSPFDPALLQAATQTLAATGAFDEVRYSYRSVSAGIAVEFQIKESVRFRRCTFDNFPFASDKEIRTFIAGKVPLYDGFAPDSGNMLDAISTSLEALANSKGISATVTHLPYTKLGTGDFEYLFKLSGPSIKIANVRFTGAQSVPESELLREAQPLLARDYSDVICREFSLNSFVPYYRERGFLKVKLAEPSAKLLPQTVSDTYNVQIDFPVIEGLAYLWEAPQWQGNKFLADGRLTSLVALKSGEAANSKKIESSWESISAEYGKHGYVQADLRPRPLYDDANRKVRFQVQIAEGQQFHMGAFSTEGFSSALAERLQSRWKLKTGEVFDASYLSDFLKKELSSALANSKGRRAKISSTLVPNQSQSTVDVVLLSE